MTLRPPRSTRTYTPFPHTTLFRSDDTPCSTSERVYECPLPAGDRGGTQYVCDGDVYCIDGSCETTERIANDEFKDAVTALHAMDEARGQFDPETLTLFRSEERRVGKECGSTVRFRWSPYHLKKKTK